LTTAAGLQPGAPVGQPEMQAATQKLTDTGLFSKVQFTFDGSELRFTLEPSGAGVPALFENFPWWNQQMLSAAVSVRVPLFHGTVVPESGMQQQVAAALTALVAEKGVQATVTSQPRSEAGKFNAVNFQIATPPVQIAEVQFAGASPAFADPINAVAKAAVAQDFNGAAEAALRTALRAIYHRQGYLDSP